VDPHHCFGVVGNVIYTYAIVTDYATVILKHVHGVILGPVNPLEI
jgi:hypothetical protein